MSTLQIFRRTWLAAGFSIVAAGLIAHAQAPATDTFQPSVGQPGKDVVWVPTPQAVVDKMLDLAQVTANDYVIDLGSGDGRTVITAAKRGAKAHGIEYNPDMVALSQKNAAAAGVTNRATFAKADLFESDFSQATVITMFLLPDINLRLRPKILDLRPGTRIVSNSFDMGDWTPDQTIQAGPECTSWCRAHLWIVPAKVGGTWKMPDGSELTLEQKYQIVTGSLRSGASNMNITTGKVIGDQITFTAGTQQYTGRVSGNTIEGIAQTSAGWRATR